MNKFYLLLSFLCFLLVVSLTQDSSQVQSYVDGDVMLKIYYQPDGTVLKREYYIDGVLTRALEYSDDMMRVERLYDENGRKVTVNQFDNNHLVSTTHYRNGIFPKVQSD